MAQAEDTELRDLVLEALEKNGSLAKIRALLRANIFLAFEDECQNIKQNVSLDNVLNLPEGVLSLCIIHEFLEFCNLKNTLFVYMSESRQGKDYQYEGKNVIADKLNLGKLDKEPLLVTLLRNTSKQLQKSYLSLDENRKNKNEKCGATSYKDDQNCTYIVHEESTATSQSQSDNSSDEKNKLHLRLPLENSDTDTSSDSARDKTSSEYIANEHILEAHNQSFKQNDSPDLKDNSQVINNKKIDDSGNNLHEQKVANNSSSDSTSYLELKPFNPMDKMMLNTSGLPVIGETNEGNVTQPNTNSTSNVEVFSPVSLSSVSTGSPKKVPTNINRSKNSPPSPKHEGESADYSLDFMPSSASSKKNISYKQGQSQENIEQDPTQKSSLNSSIDSQHQNSNSSQSSVSISDVADLINENLSFKRPRKSNDWSDNSRSKSRSLGKHKFNDVSFNIHLKHSSDDSGDFSESPIPSLSNLSLDIHSD